MSHFNFLLCVCSIMHNVHPGYWLFPATQSMPAPGRIASSSGSPLFPFPVPQPYRYAVPSIQPEEPASQPPMYSQRPIQPEEPVSQPPMYSQRSFQVEEPVCRPPMPTLTVSSARSQDTTARSVPSVRTPGGSRSRRPSMAEAANVVRSTSSSSRSVAAASRGRLAGKPVQQSAPRPATKPLPSKQASGRLNMPTISSENRAKSPGRHGKVPDLRTKSSTELRSKSPARVTSDLRSKSPARVTSEVRSKSPARILGSSRATPVSLAEASPVSSKPQVPLMRYELQISYNDHVVARSPIKAVLSEDGPFLYVIQSELDSPLTFIPHPEMPCSFTGLSISVLATNTRTRKTNVVFQSHGSHIENPPVNEMDGYFSHSCWLSGPSASVVGGVRMYFRREEEESAVTIYAMSLKFWFPESAANGLEQTPQFTREHYKELLKLLGVLNP